MKIARQLINKERCEELCFEEEHLLQSMCLFFAILHMLILVVARATSSTC